MSMATSNKPYLVRAIHSWCLDCDFTPHVLAGTGYDGVEVPEEYITDGQIVFNVAPSATRDLKIDNDAVTFYANFGKKVVKINLPMESIIAIYAYENGDGITFDEDEGNTDIEYTDVYPSLVETPTIYNGEQSDATPKKTTSKKGKPTLTIIK